MNFGDAIADADVPSVGVEEAVVVPAQQDPVVRMRSSTLRVLLNVVDFAPRGTDAAAGDDASAVA